MLYHFHATWSLHTHSECEDYSDDKDRRAGALGHLVLMLGSPASNSATVEAEWQGVHDHDIGIINSEYLATRIYT